MPNEELMKQRKTRSTVVVYVESGIIAEYGLEARYTQVSVVGSTVTQEVYLTLTQQVYENTVIAKDAAIDASNQAQDSAQEAKDSENLSRQWAINPVDELVPGHEDYSSMHYAMLSKSYQEYALMAQQASEQARNESVLAKEESEQARDDSQVHRQAAEQAEIASNQSAQDAEQSKEDAEQAAADSLTHSQAAQVARQGAEDAQGAAEQAQQASEDARDISIQKADESAQSAASAEQSAQNVQAMETNVTNLHGEVETNTLTVSDLADQVSNDRSQVASDAQDVRDDRDEVRGLKTETQIYRNQSEQFKNDAEAAAAAASGGLLPVGGWDASTGNFPPTPDDNTQPWYRITVAGTLPGIGQVNVGDNIYWSRSFLDWFHIDNTERFTSINGYTGGVVELDTGDIPENGPQFHTQARVRGTALTGLSETSSSKPSATDTVISALGKIVSKLWSLAVGDISGLQGELDSKLNSNHSSVTNSREWTASTVSQSEAEAGTSSTRRAWTAQRVRQAIVGWWNGVTSSWGRSFVASSDAQAGRSVLDLGSMATSDTGTGGAQHRTNSQNDSRFGRLTENNTWTSYQDFAGGGINLRRSNNSTSHVYFRESDDTERALIWSEPFSSGDNGLRARVKDEAGGTTTEWRMTRNGQFYLSTGVFRGDGSLLTNIPWSGLTGKPAKATRWPTFAEVTGKPTTFAPSAHTHGFADLPITSSQVSNWDSAHSWGNHADAGYAVTGTGSSQVRTNSQLDARYSRSDTTYSAGTGLSLSGTTFSLSGDSFNSSGNYANLRARGTTAADVGVRTNSQNDERYARLPELIYVSSNLTLDSSHFGNTLWVTSNVTITVPVIYSHQGQYVQIITTSNGRVKFATSGANVSWMDGSGSTKPGSSANIAGGSAASLLSRTTDHYVLFGNGIS